MINKIKEFFVKVHGFDEVEEVDAKESLVRLYNVLKGNFEIITFRDFIEKTGARFNGEDEVLCEFYNEEDRNLIYKMKREFNGTIQRYHPSLYSGNSYSGRIELKIDMHEAYKRDELAKDCLISNRILPSINSIFEAISTKNEKNYRILLEKYEDTFVTLISTIKEMKKAGGIDDNDKRVIIDIIQSFIDEFNSLQELFRKKSELDKAAHKDSLRRRLEDELELVGKIKTDWNNTFADMENFVEKTN